MIKTRFSRWLTFFTFAAAVALALPAKANTWPLPPAWPEKKRDGPLPRKGQAPRRTTRSQAPSRTRSIPGRRNPRLPNPRPLAELYFSLLFMPSLPAFRGAFSKPDPAAASEWAA